MQNPIVANETLTNSRRSSTRSIKRRKFDDELVESSLVKSERVRLRQQALSESKQMSLSASDVDIEHSEPVMVLAAEKKKVHKVRKSNRPPRRLCAKVYDQSFVRFDSHLLLFSAVYFEQYVIFWVLSLMIFQALKYYFIIFWNSMFMKSR